MADCKKHVLSKVVQNIIFHNKTSLVMFYRYNKTFWYEFCNFKHFLKAEHIEDSLASSCEEFSISFRVTQYETGLLLELMRIMCFVIWRKIASAHGLSNYKPLTNQIIH